jgi:shikimate dehydrogenase
MPVVRGEALEVWGDPIEHSRSPALHAAGYAVLGLPWSYGRRQVTVGTFEQEFADLDPSFRGLSLTYPLKGVAHTAAATRDAAAELTGAVNTLLVGVEGGPHGVNTDVGGIVRDLRDHGVDGLDQARLVGAGATATSALVALAELGARRVDVLARRPQAVAGLQALGDRLGVVVQAVPITAGAHAPTPLTIATLPGDAALSARDADAVATSGGLLYDVVYGTWPTPLAEAWARAGNTAVNGLGMLVQQALLQVRVFCTGDAGHALPDEPAVLAAMRAAAA